MNVDLLCSSLRYHPQGCLPQGGHPFPKKTSSRNILGKYTRNSNTKLLASAFKSYVLGYIRSVPTITPAEIDAVLEDVAMRNPKAKSVDPKQFYDPAPLEQLAREGFIKELYPR